MNHFFSYYTNHGALIWGGYFCEKENNYANGGILLAPNGKPSNLSEENWKLVRTFEFKDWFGDWEKVARINKFLESPIVNLRKEKPRCEVPFHLHGNNTELYKYFRGRFNNTIIAIDDSGREIAISNRGCDKVINHNANFIYDKILPYIDSVLSQSVFITSHKNTHPTEKIEVPRYLYFFSELILLDETNATSYIVVKETRQWGYKFYDLTVFKKSRSELLADIQLSRLGATTNPDLHSKDKKLSLIFDTSQKFILDENGEPKISEILRYLSEKSHILAEGGKFPSGNKVKIGDIIEVKSGGKPERVKIEAISELNIYGDFVPKKHATKFHMRTEEFVKKYGDVEIPYMVKSIEHKLTPELKHLREKLREQKFTWVGYSVLDDWEAKIDEGFNKIERKQYHYAKPSYYLVNEKFHREVPISGIDRKYVSGVLNILKEEGKLARGGEIDSDFEYSLYQLYPNIFLLEMESGDDLALSFVRCQVFYEWDEFKGRHFELDEFKKYFAEKFKTNDGKFTYPKEFYGFNVPSDAIKDCYRINDERNKYDEFFLHIANEIEKNTNDDYYLIGIRSGDYDTLEHELAHAFFWADEDYRNDMTSFVNNLPDKERFFKILSEERGYGHDVLIDEAQAFMATGLIKNINDWEKYREPFIKRFNQQKGMDNFKMTEPILENKKSASMMADGGQIYESKSPDEIFSYIKSLPDKFRITKLKGGELYKVFDDGFSTAMNNSEIVRFYLKYLRDQNKTSTIIGIPDNINKSSYEKIYALLKQGKSYRDPIIEEKYKKSGFSSYDPPEKREQDDLRAIFWRWFRIFNLLVYEDYFGAHYRNEASAHKLVQEMRTPSDKKDYIRFGIKELFDKESPMTYLSFGADIYMPAIGVIEKYNSGRLK